MDKHNIEIMLQMHCLNKILTDTKYQQYKIKSPTG